MLRVYKMVESTSPLADQQIHTQVRYPDRMDIKTEEKQRQ